MEPTSAPARPLWDRIQTACAERGWNGVRLERESGVARQTVNKWRTQPRPPQAATVNAVARALDIPPDEALRLAGILPADDQHARSVGSEEPSRPISAIELEELRDQLRQVQKRLDQIIGRDEQRDAG